MSTTTLFILGMVLVLVEVIAIPGIGFLFAGLAAISLGGLITYGFVEAQTIVDQIAYLFALTIIWWVVLWTPIKKFTKNKKGDGFDNLVGTYGTVDEEGGLVAGKLGHVKWSGTRMRARICPGSSVEKIENGEAIWVHEQKDGILLVDITKPENKQ